MQVHSVIGSELLTAFLSTKDLAGIVAAHHERFDGNGYPNGIQGAKISLAARVLAIADTIDAMLARRTGCQRLDDSEVRTEIIREAGHQFDPSIVEVLARRWPGSGEQPRGVI